MQVRSEEEGGGEGRGGVLVQVRSGEEGGEGVGGRAAVQVRSEGRWSHECPPETPFPLIIAKGSGLRDYSGCAFLSNAPLTSFPLTTSFFTPSA